MRSQRTWEGPTRASAGTPRLCPSLREPSPPACLACAERQEEMRMRSANPNASSAVLVAVCRRGEGGLNLYRLRGHVPLGVSYADFFLADRRFDLFSRNQRFQTSSARSRSVFWDSQAIDLVFIFRRLSALCWPSKEGRCRGGGQKSGIFRSRTGGLGTQTISRICENIFLRRGGACSEIRREIPGG
jgi:hypothetical protein